MDRRNGCPLTSIEELCLARTSLPSPALQLQRTRHCIMHTHFPQSGGLASAHLHVARAVCRRAERAVAQLVDSEQAPPVAQRYLNRLSDFLFVASRFASQQSGVAEQVYQKDQGVAASSQEVKERQAAAAATAAAASASK